MTENTFGKKMRHWGVISALVVMVALMAPGLALAFILPLVVDTDSEYGDTFTMPPPDSITFQIEIIGSTGSGTFTQSGGTNTVTDILALAFQSGSSGTYNLSAGVLSAGEEIIGWAGSGTFTQNSGTHIVTNNLTLASQSGSSGTYNLEGGAMSANNEVIGDSGTGTLTQNDGTNTVSFLFLGLSLNSSGTYELSGTGRLRSANEFVGVLGNGSFTQGGGTHTVTNNFILGNTGSYNLEGGSLSAGTIQVNSGGTFNVTGVGDKLITTVTGDVNNAGTVKTTNAEVTWDGTFTITEGGEYCSVNAINKFNDLFIQDTGILKADQDSEIVIAGNITNMSDGLDTSEAKLTFTVGGSHTYTYSGDERWNILDITGTSLTLEALGSSFTVGSIVGLETENDLCLNLVSSEDIYIDELPAELVGILTSGGGRLLLTPVPASLLLMGSGLLGLGLLGWRKKRS